MNSTDLQGTNFADINEKQRIQNNPSGSELIPSFQQNAGAPIDFSEFLNIDEQPILDLNGKLN